MSGSTYPLDGIRVLDLTQVMFGPCATQVLGDFGADIIKIEKPTSGDLSRSYDPFVKDDGGESAYFMGMNRNKRSLALDVTKEEGREIALKLAMDADVIVHNFRPGVAERLGLDYVSLSQKNPKIIYASGSGFGEDGPLAHKGGQDNLAQALSGVAFRNADEHGRPQLYPTAMSDFSGGMILVQGILLALLQRAQTGRGQRVKVNLLDTLLVMQQQEATQYLLRQKEVNWLKQNPMHIFETSDGFIVFIGAYRPNPIADLCRALDIEDITALPQFSTLSEQMKNRDKMYELLGRGFKTYSTEECLRRLEGEDLLCAPVLSIGEALAQPQVQNNNLLIEFGHPVHGRVRTTGSALKLSDVNCIATKAPPTLGQHSTEILLEMGCDDKKIENLRKAGIVR